VLYTCWQEFVVEAAGRGAVEQLVGRAGADLADVAGYHSLLVLADETSGTYRALSLWATKMEAASAGARIEAWLRHHLAPHGFRLLQPAAILAVVDPPPAAGRGGAEPSRRLS
jgi:hypothetical protein